jgi:hypothetical protein
MLAANLRFEISHRCLFWSEFNAVYISLAIMHVEVSPVGPGYILSFGRGGFFPLPPLRTRAQ